MTTEAMTTEKSFAIYEAVLKEKNPYYEGEWLNIPATQEEKIALREKRWAWKEQHDKKLAEAFHNLVPAVGLKGTVIYWSDSRAVTISRIISPKKVAVRFHKVRCIDYLSSEYEILPEFDENEEEIFTKRKNGRWIYEDHPTKDGVRLVFHYQRHYIDPNF